MVDDQPASTPMRGLARSIWEVPATIQRVATPVLVWTATFLLLMSLAAVTSALPGVGNQIHRPILAILLPVQAAVFGLGAFIVARSRARTWRCAARLCLYQLRTLLTSLGMLPSPGQAWRLAGIGILGAWVVATVGTWLITNAPLAPTVGEDPRRAAVEHAPGWAIALTYAAAGPWEEWLWRSPVLLASTWLLTPGASRQRLLGSWCAIGLLTLITSGIFGWSHLEYSASNVATAAAGGIIYATLAIFTRSLWPAIIAHSLSNVIATWEW